MRIKAILTADSATRDESGKLTIAGIFSEIRAPAFPATHQKMCLVLIFEGERPQYEYFLQVKMGNQVLADSPKQTLKRTSSSNNWELMINIVNLAIPKQGTLAFSVSLDSEVVTCEVQAESSL